MASASTSWLFALPAVGDDGCVDGASRPPGADGRVVLVGHRADDGDDTGRVLCPVRTGARRRARRWPAISPSGGRDGARTTPGPSSPPPRVLDSGPSSTHLALLVDRSARRPDRSQALGWSCAPRATVGGLTAPQRTNSPQGRWEPAGCGPRFRVGRGWSARPERLGDGVPAGLLVGGLHQRHVCSWASVIRSVSGGSSTVRAGLAQRPQPGCWSARPQGRARAVPASSGIKPLVASWSGCPALLRLPSCPTVPLVTAVSRSAAPSLRASFRRTAAVPQPNAIDHAHRLRLDVRQQRQVLLRIAARSNRSPSVDGPHAAS